MTLAILPIALVYSEISPLFHTAGGELIYNTVGFNRHVGFLASWLIMAAWISVPPAVVMAIVTFISRTFGLGLTFGHTMIIGIIILVAVFLMSMQDIQFLVKAHYSAHRRTAALLGPLELCQCRQPVPDQSGALRRHSRMDHRYGAVHHPLLWL